MKRLARESAAIALTAPYVAALRLAQLSLAGARPSARDRREFALMGMEKVAAFYESWNAMVLQAWRLQLTMWMSAFAPAWRADAFGPTRSLRALQRAAAQVLAAGLVPVRRRTTANARRLGRTTRRR